MIESMFANAMIDISFSRRERKQIPKNSLERDLRSLTISYEYHLCTKAQRIA